MNLALLDATANTGMGGTIGGTIMLVVYVAVIMGFFYFFFSRPQKKEKNRLQAMLDALEVGDAICTTSGFYGIVIDITDDTVIVEFGNNKQCRIPMQKSAIAQVEKAETES